MNIMFPPLLLATFLSILFITSKTAQLVRAERYQMIWVFMIWLFASLLTLGFVLMKFDVPLVLICMLIILTLLYNFIGGMDLGGALVVNIASLGVSILLFTLVFSIFGQNYIPNIKKHMVNMGIIDTPSTTIMQAAPIQAPQTKKPSLAKATQRFSISKRAQFNHQYQRVSLDKAYRYEGRDIRIRKTNGRIIVGKMAQATKSALIVTAYLGDRHTKRMSMPVHKSSIQLFEAQF